MRSFVGRLEVDDVDENGLGESHPEPIVGNFFSALRIVERNIFSAREDRVVA